MHIFLTGAPNIGKTALINGILRSLPTDTVTGGFRTYMGDDFAPGKNYVLIASVTDVSSNFGRDDDLFSKPEIHKVALRDKGRPGFEIYSEVFDDVGFALLEKSSKSDIIIMDELGFLESDAYKFQAKVMEILDGDTPVLGVIKPKENPFLNKIRNHSGVRIIEVTEENRNSLTNKIMKSLHLVWGGYHGIYMDKREG